MVQSRLKTKQTVKYFFSEGNQIYTMLSLFKNKLAWMQTTFSNNLDIKGGKDIGL